MATAVGSRSMATQVDIGAELEQYRKELVGYCYRMLASPFEAEDAVQDTMVRAWRAADRFEGRSSLRSWLYRIATNVCLDILRGPPRPPPPLPEATRITPVPTEKVLRPEGDPAEVAAARESIRLALIAALQHLPPRQ